MAMIKPIMVFYRDFPAILEDFVRKDGHMTLIRDGARPLGPSGSDKCPRLTILIEALSPAKDPDRVLRLANLLDELDSNGQIIAYRDGGA